MPEESPASRETRDAGIRGENRQLRSALAWSSADESVVDGVMVESDDDEPLEGRVEALGVVLGVLLSAADGEVVAGAIDGGVVVDGSVDDCA